MGENVVVEEVPLGMAETIYWRLTSLIYFLCLSMDVHQIYKYFVLNKCLNHFGMLIFILTGVQ